MIVFVPGGGLGNILFEHSAAWVHSKETGQELHALGYYPDCYTKRAKLADYPNLFKHVKILGERDKHPYSENWPGNPSQLQYISQLTGETRVWQEPYFYHNPIPSDARILTGYFQSWKYFDKYRIELRDLLRSNDSILWEEQKSRVKGGVCVHIRWGGDGLAKPLIHPVCSREYYSDAMKLFPNNKFLLFCEEPDLIKDFEGEVIYEPDPLKTLFLMSCCDHFIIANSSLSLMAYYMRENEDARLVAPRNWFGPQGPAYKLDDLVKPSDRVTLL